MRSVRFLLLALLLPLPSLSQATDAPSGLMDRIEQTRTESRLNDAAAQPWHLKLALTLDGRKDAASETGSIVVWWSGPKSYRVTYDTPDYKSTEVKTEEGLFRTPDMPSAPYRVHRLLDQVVDPFAEEALAGVMPELRKQSFGKATLDCVMLDRKIAGFQGYLPLGLFPTYCLDPG